MPMMLQDMIHKLEEGSGSRYLSFTAGILAILALAVFYDAAAFRNLSTPEAMDAAQLARNIAEGQGYTTLFIRPLSLHLVFRSVTNRLADLMPAKPGSPQPPPTAEQSRLIRLMHLEEPHPDLANPPLYPLLLAGALKIMPYDYPVSATRSFRVYKPDLWIACFNQLLFAAAGLLVFGLARRLFDEPVAWVSAAVVLGAELLWRFSVSGQSTLLLMVLLLGVVWALVRADQAARAVGAPMGSDGAPLAGRATGTAVTHGGNAGEGRVIAWAVAAGVLVGLAGLTRYAFGTLIAPAAIFLGTVPARRRGLLATVAVAGFLLVMSPWVVRNLHLSGAPFGTAGFAIYQNTSQFSGDELERTSNPIFSEMTGADYFRKGLRGVRDILQNDLPKLGGSWVSAFFLVGLLVPFRNPTLARLRWFLVGGLALFVVVQAVGRTNLTAESPEVNSENLLVVWAPLVFMFGVSLLFLLLDQVGMPFPAARYLTIGLFCLASCAPLVFVFLAPPASPVAFPPYYPPWIQDKTGWLGEKDLLMTDIPWATAWYGRRQSVWLSLKVRNRPTDRWRNDFYEIHSYIKKVRGLYLSAKTMKTIESQALDDWGYFAELEPGPGGAGGETAPAWRWEEGPASGDWSSLIAQALIKHQVPSGFPLRRAPRGVLPELFLTDSEQVAPETIQ